MPSGITFTIRRSQPSKSQSSLARHGRSIPPNSDFNWAFQGHWQFKHILSQPDTTSKTAKAVKFNNQSSNQIPAGYALSHTNTGKPPTLIHYQTCPNLWHVLKIDPCLHASIWSVWTRTRCLSFQIHRRSSLTPQTKFNIAIPSRPAQISSESLPNVIQKPRPNSLQWVVLLYIVHATTNQKQN